MNHVLSKKQINRLKKIAKKIIDKELIYLHFDTSIVDEKDIDIFLDELDKKISAIKTGDTFFFDFGNETEKI